MPLTRTAMDPLLSEEEALRHAALLQLTNLPSPEAARSVVRALLHFLQQKPEVAQEFEDALSRPPLSLVAEEPVLELLDHKETAVREEAAYLLYRIRIRESSRARVQKALLNDGSAWVRGYAAKALALLGGQGVGGLLAGAIHNEATLESISRMGEALALLNEPPRARVLLDQAEQIRERTIPGGGDPLKYKITAAACALFLEALAAVLDANAVRGAKREDLGPQAWRVTLGRSGTVELAGGKEHQGFAARVHGEGDPEVLLRQDSPKALELLPAKA